MMPTAPPQSQNTGPRHAQRTPNRNLTGHARQTDDTQKQNTHPTHIEPRTTPSTHPPETPGRPSTPHASHTGEAIPPELPKLTRTHPHLPSLRSGGEDGPVGLVAVELLDLHAKLAGLCWPVVVAELHARADGGARHPNEGDAAEAVPSHLTSHHEAEAAAEALDVESVRLSL